MNVYEQLYEHLAPFLETATNGLHPGIPLRLVRTGTAEAWDIYLGAYTAVPGVRGLHVIRSNDVRETDSLSLHLFEPGSKVKLDTSSDPSNPAGRLIPALWIQHVPMVDEVRTIQLDALSYPGARLELALQFLNRIHRFIGPKPRYVTIPRSR